MSSYYKEYEIYKKTWSCWERVIFRDPIFLKPLIDIPNAFCLPHLIYSDIPWTMGRGIINDDLEARCYAIYEIVNYVDDRIDYLIRKVTISSEK